MIYIACVFLLMALVRLADGQFLVPLMGSQQPDPSTGLVYQVTVSFGRSGPLEYWYVGYWLATFHQSVNWIAGALLVSLLLYGLYSKIKPAA